MLRPRAVAVRLMEHSLELWKDGRAASPDDRDYVICCCMALGIDWRANVETVERLANTLFEDSGETYVTLDDIAVYVLAELRKAVTS